MLTADEIRAIEPGTRLNMNFSGTRPPREDSWTAPWTVIEVVGRGKTDDIHPLGGGHPFVLVRCRRQGQTTGSVSVGIGIDSEDIRLAQD